MSIRVSRPESYRASNSSIEVRADAIRYSMIADASAYLEGKWKYIAPLVTSASARMSSRLTKLYDLRANWREAARRICTRVVSARLSRCSVTFGPRNLDSRAGGQAIAVAAINQSPHSFTPGPPKDRRADLAAQTTSTALLDARHVLQGKQICQYSKSCLDLHNSQKVCKVLDVMTLGPARAPRPLAADPEVSGSVARWIPLSPGNSRWYFYAVAIVRAGKPPRTPLRAVATSCQPLVLPARSVERERRNFAHNTSHAAAKSAASVWVSDDLAMPR